VAGQVVPGLEVGAVHAERLQDLRDGAVHVVHVVTEHRGGRGDGLGFVLGLQEQRRRRRASWTRHRVLAWVHVAVDVEVGDGAEAAELYRRQVVGPGRLFLGSCMGKRNKNSVTFQIPGLLQ
jgi:hypothetical protein